MKMDIWTEPCRRLFFKEVAAYAKISRWELIWGVQRAVNSLRGVRWGAVENESGEQKRSAEADSVGQLYQSQ